MSACLSFLGEKSPTRRRHCQPSYREDEDCGGYIVPYEIQLDDGDLVSAPEDLDTCIRASIVPPVPLRFNKGDRVICMVEKEWLPGTILKCRHRDEDFDDGRIILYQVRLDAGSGFKPRVTWCMPQLMMTRGTVDEVLAHNL